MNIESFIDEIIKLSSSDIPGGMVGGDQDSPPDPVDELKPNDAKTRLKNGPPPRMTPGRLGGVTMAKNPIDGVR